ncbi:titin homolog isoform X2 [Ptychodera flava]|uniref:titin homolog isoform X2 n=1 Tax=Ptychodera flava TaxID=63121 RepID=UPI00396A3582
MMIMEKVESRSPTTRPSTIRWRDPDVEEEHDNRFVSPLESQAQSQKVYGENSKLTDLSADVEIRSPVEHKRQNGVPENVFVAPVISRETSKLRTPGFQIQSRNSLRSRARPRKSFEPTPFLSVDNLPAGTTVSTDHERTVKTSGKPRRTPRKPKQIEKPQTADPYFSFGRGTISPPRSPRPVTTPSVQGFMTPIEFYNVYKKKKGELKKGKLRALSRASSQTSNHSRHSFRSPSTLAGPPTLWSLGNRYWPKPVQYVSENPVPPLYAADPANRKPNTQVMQPFKHGPNVSEEIESMERAPSPSQEMKEMTAIGILEVSRTFARQRAPVVVKKSGRLLKARLKPLQDFKQEGPTIYQCRGVIAQKRDHSASQVRMLQRKKELLAQLKMKDIKFERLKTQESIHRTSIASEQDLVERDHDFMNGETQIWVNKLSEYPLEESEADEENQNIPPNGLTSDVSQSEIVQSSETQDPGATSETQDGGEETKLVHGLQETENDAEAVSKETDVAKEEEMKDGTVDDVQVKDNAADGIQDGKDEMIVAKQQHDVSEQPDAEEPDKIVSSEDQVSEPTNVEVTDERKDTTEKQAEVNEQLLASDDAKTVETKQDGDVKEVATPEDERRVTTLENIEERTEASSQCESSKRSPSQGDSVSDKAERIQKDESQGDETVEKIASPDNNEVQTVGVTETELANEDSKSPEQGNTADFMPDSQTTAEKPDETAPPQAAQVNKETEPVAETEVTADTSAAKPIQEVNKTEVPEDSSATESSQEVDKTQVTTESSVTEPSQEVDKTQVTADNTVTEPSQEVDKTQASADTSVPEPISVVDKTQAPADRSATNDSQEVDKIQSPEVMGEIGQNDVKVVIEKTVVETSQEIISEQTGKDGTVQTTPNSAGDKPLDTQNSALKVQNSGQREQSTETENVETEEKGIKKEKQQEPEDADESGNQDNKHPEDKKDGNDPGGAGSGGGGGDAGGAGDGGSHGNSDGSQGGGGQGGGGNSGNDRDGNNDKRDNNGDKKDAETDEESKDSTQDEEEEASLKKPGAMKLSSDSDEYCDFCGLDSEMCVCPNSKVLMKSKRTAERQRDGKKEMTPKQNDEQKVSTHEMYMIELDKIEKALRDSNRILDTVSKTESGNTQVGRPRPSSAYLHSHTGHTYLPTVKGKKSSLMSSTASSRARQRPQSAKFHSDRKHSSKHQTHSTPTRPEEFSELDPSSELEKIVAEYKEMFGTPEAAYSFHQGDAGDDEFSFTSPVPNFIPETQRLWLDSTVNPEYSVEQYSRDLPRPSRSSRTSNQSHENLPSHDDVCDSGHVSEAVSLAGDKDEEEEMQIDAGFSELSLKTDDSLKKMDIMESQTIGANVRDSPEKLTVVATTKTLSKARLNKTDISFPLAPFPPLSFRINAVPPVGKVYYFAYGADMNPNRMTTYIGRDIDHRLWGILFGFRLKFNKKGSDMEAGGFPNIECDSESSVEGCVYLLNHSELGSLDRFMGYPEHYTRVMLPVWMINCCSPSDLGIAQYCVPAVMYVAQDKWTHDDDCLQYDYSLSQCLKGSDLLSKSYRDHLSSLKHTNPLPPIPTTTVAS